MRRQMSGSKMRFSVNRAFFHLFILITLSFSEAFAATIRVPEDHLTIQEAVDSALNGDTILISPGTYLENIRLTDKSLLILSSCGRENTIIDGNGGAAFDLSLQGGGKCEVRGLSITNSDWGIHADGNNPDFDISDSYFYGNNIAILGSQHVSFRIANCLIVQNGTGYQQTYYGNDSSIINSTFADNDIDVSFTPAYSTTSQLNILNSILTDSITGTDGNPVYLHYCSYVPSELEINVQVRKGCVTGTPLFVDPVNTDYRLQAESPCIDTGDPNAFYNDSDLSRNDIGYTGGSKLSVKTGSLDYGYVAIGRSKGLPLIIHNGQQTEITLDALYTGDSQLSTPASFPIVVPSGSDVTITIAYNPTASSSFESLVRIDSADLNGALYAVFPVTGYGVATSNGVINVPSQAPTIQAAVDASSDGDTILIAPGTYYENTRVVNKQIAIASSGGRKNTIIDGNGGAAFDLSLQGGGKCEVRGLSITNSDWGIHADGNNSDFDISDSYFYGNNIAILGSLHVSFRIVNCLLVQNGTGYQQTYYGNDSSIINSTFADNDIDVSFTPAYGTTSQLNIVNSILTDGVAGTVDNPVYLYYCNYVPENLGINSTNQEGCQIEGPLFVDPANGDYHLQFASPCIDSGTPQETLLNDMDGTARPQGAEYDLGAFEFYYLTVTTAIPSSITPNSALSGGNVVHVAGGSVTARGACWNTSANPTIDDNITMDDVGEGSFTSTLTGLIPGTIYHVRAYATNSEGTVYGNDVSFTTTGLCGDVNENGRVDIGDAMFISQWLVGNRLASELNRDVGDANVNDRIDIGDAMFIAQYLVGNRNCLCEGTGMEVCGE